MTARARVLIASLEDESFSLGPTNKYKSKNELNQDSPKPAEGDTQSVSCRGRPCIRC